jgi:hypothetical protein
LGVVVSVGKVTEEQRRQKAKAKAKQKIKNGFKPSPSALAIFSF